MAGVRVGEDLDRPGRSSRAVPSRLAARVDAVLDGTIVVLATWTVVYHLSLLLDVRSNVALGVEAAVLAGTVVSRRSASGGRARRAQRAGVETDLLNRRATPVVEEGSQGPSRNHLATRVTVAAAVVSAVAMALDAPWALVWVSWLAAAVAGVVAVWPGADADPGVRTPGDDRREGWFALGCALVLAVFSTVTLRPNPDDLYYVNLSQWVAEHGTFPVRDTLFADLVYPMSNWPPLASYDGLGGAVAHLLGIPAGDVVYVVVPPVATALAVLALWRLLRTWRVRHVVLALAVGLLFLLVDGTSSYGPPGNLFLTRLWQGKVILLCVLVPTLLTYALQHAERPSRRTLVRLLLGGLAAVACSTTAIFLVPLLALAGAVPLLRRSTGRAVAGFTAMAAYPLAAGVATLASGGRSADDFGERRGYRFDPGWFGHAVFLTDLLALLAVLAVLVGCLVVPHPAARLTTGLLVTATGITFVPGFTRLAYDIVGLGPTLWRVTWVCTVAALVGAGASYLWIRAPTPLVARTGLGVLVVALVAFGKPIWASDTSTDLAAPPHWQRTDAARRVTTWIVAHSEPGRPVLAPDGLAITVAVSTTDVKTVAPRDYYMSYLRDEPGFRYDDRLLLVDFVNDAPGRREDIGPALRALDVGVACVDADDLRGFALLQASGWTPGLDAESYRCLTGPEQRPNSG